MYLKHGGQLVLVAECEDVLHIGQAVEGPLAPIREYDADCICAGSRNRGNGCSQVVFIPGVCMIYAPHDKRAASGID
ncbi:hypothetical protein D3C75_961730 [compost metagenome]